MENQRVSDDVDLLHAAAKFYWILKNNVVLIILCVVVGIGLGIVLSRFAKDAVKSRMMVETAFINQQEAKFLVNELDGINFLPGKRSKLEYDVKTGDREDKNIYIIVTASAGDTTDLSHIQASIKKFLNQSEPFLRRKKETAEVCLNMIKEINIQLADLASVKEKVDDKSKATFLNPADLFTKTVDLYNKRLNYEIELQNAESVHIVKGFDTVARSARIPSSMYVLAGLLFGGIVAIVALVLKRFSKYYREFEKRNAT